MTRTQSGPPVAWIWAGVAVLAVLLISVLIWVLAIRPEPELPGNARLVPDVVGMTFDGANELLREAELRPFQVEEASEEVPEGLVIRTDPVAGTSVAPAQQVRVYVSTGIERVAVPTLVGLTEADARAALQAAGLSLGVIEPRNDPDTAGGTVMEADPVEGSEVPITTSVNLVVATGRVVIVDYVGYTLEAATRELASLRLTVEPVEDPTCVATGSQNIVAQSLAPGDVPIHSTISLTYCTGEAAEE